MEKEFFLQQQQPAWNSGNMGGNDFSSYFSSNWDSLMTGQPDPFESSLAPPSSASSGAMIELIGRLEGGISNPNNVSGSFHATQTRQQQLNSSSPTQHPTRSPNLAPLISADPGFAERAARFSKFGSRSFSGRSGPFGELSGISNNGIGSGLEGGKMMTRVSSCQALKFPGSERKQEGFSRSATPDNGEESSVSEQMIPGEDLGAKSHNNESNPRKRKSAARGKKENKIQEGAVNSEELDAKRTKSEESNGKETNGRKGNGKASGSGKGKNDSKNSSEPPKDYIHVRARRGQATDSHSLAERVRREKISQRMKFLQDLVPGCNKVTGKAVMLDEIINYVQSLQRQVEFLSMKLSTVNPRADINVEALLSKDLQQARSLLSQSMYALESSTTASAFSYGYQSHGPPVQNVHSNGTETPYSMSPLNTQKQNLGQQLPSMDGFDDSASQVSMWVDELHNVGHMRYSQSQQQDFQGSLTTYDMKMEH